MRASPSCYEKAVDLLSRRPHFVAEIRRKLVQRDYEEDEIRATLDRLIELAYLDDERCARGFVQTRRRRGPIGRRRLLHELTRRGAERDLATGLVAEISDQEERDAAGQAAALRRSRGADKPAIARHLDRKGFGKRVILEVLAELQG